MKTLRLHIVSPDGELFDGEVQKVSLPGSKAPFTVLPLHAPIISSLTKGYVRFTTADGAMREHRVAGGFVEVKNDMVTVCIE